MCRNIGIKLLSLAYMYTTLTFLGSTKVHLLALKNETIFTGPQTQSEPPVREGDRLASLETDGDCFRKD